MPLSNGLGSSARLTQSSYRQAVSETVRDLQEAGTDRDMADVWGVSGGTVENARNRKHDLSAMGLLKLGERFGPAALDTVLSLIGAKAVARDDMTVNVGAIPRDIAAMLPMMMDCFADSECCAKDVRKLDEAGVIDRLIEVADMLRSARDKMRLQAVG